LKVSLKTLLISFFLLLLSVALGVSVGSEPINFHSISDLQKSILLEIRLPRVLLAATVGASLSISGAALQALLRNPLAEPYLLGVSNGAALGTLLAFVFPESTY